MPKVSVIVPVYNTDKYLVKCLDSLVNQTIDSIEIVAIDDGATDNSPAILDSYAEKYPDKMLVRHKKNGGQASARNMALKLCTGEFIGFLDSDDFVETTMFEELYNKAMEEHADYVGCGYKDLYDNNGQIEILKEYVGNKPCTSNREMFLGGAKVSPFINFYKRELITDHNIFFTEGYIYEDTAFWAKIVPYITKPVYLEKALACRVRHENSTTTITKPEKVANIFPVISDIAGYYKQNGLFDDYRNEVTYFCSRVLLCSSMDRISTVKKKQDRNKLIGDTFEYLKANFPDYKKNTLLKSNKIDTYIKKSSRFVCKCMVLALRIKKN